jgi:hypothetical protein
MYTFLNDPHFFVLTGTNGQIFKIGFRPGDTALDKETDVLLSMCVRFNDGSFQDLILMPSNSTAMEVTDFVADLIGEIGGQIVTDQILLGNIYFDSIAEALIGHAKDYRTGILKRYFRQVNGAYYDARNGALMATNALTKYDVMFD